MNSKLKNLNYKVEGNRRYETLVSPNFGVLKRVKK